MRQYDRGKTSYPERLYLGNLRRMKGERKLTIASQLSELTRELSRCGIRKRNPQFSKEQVEKDLWRIIRHDTE